ncbi:MAG: 23S rRNA (uracil(1939)-C(5))-methyltransferase RlmD [Chitinophagales bacterium]|nr:23S rRNA (uracil(1939)-C(5))-methyltransferase RlmD [Chitinophagales bacterium]
MRKANKRVIIEDLEITKMAAEGRAIGRKDGKVVFVDYATPGDVVNVQTITNKKDYAIASIINIQQAAPYRIQPVCEHFGTCGGCRWQHIPYQQQLHFKQQLVEEAFQRIGHLKHPAIKPIIGAPDVYSYRNKMEYTFSNRAWLTQEQINSGEDFDRRALGFHVPGRFDGIMQINKCHLQEDIGNQIRNFIYSFATSHQFSFYDVKNHGGLLRNLILRNNIAGEWMVILSFGESDENKMFQLLDAIKAHFPQIISLNYVVNTKKNDTLYDQDIINYWGVAYLTEQLGELKYKIGPKSFFQTNSKQAKNLYDIVKNMATIHPDDIVYDLYTGTGTIALYVAQTAKKVIGIETVEEAIVDANFNMELNQIQNAKFVAAPVENILDEEFILQHGKPEVVITDPPRAGMHEKVIEVLLKAAPQQIVYVSCNPATQARDLNLLSEKYDILEVQPVDMFPNTFHIENVVNLKLKNED